jgi:hypothetical protein
MVFADATWLDEPAVGATVAQPKIENLGVPALCYEDVCGFNVSVDDTFRVSRIESVSNLNPLQEQRLVV